VRPVAQPVAQPVAPGERGAALLAVLLLVAVVGALAAAALEKLRLSTALAMNGVALDQARGFAVGIESLMALRIDDLVVRGPEQTILAGGWNGQTRRVPLPGGGLAEAMLRDGGNCFNINSVAEGAVGLPLRSRPTGIVQFASLLRLFEVPEANAFAIAEAAADWVDSDTEPNRAGAEDDAYRSAGQPYRPGNTLFADISELRAVAGMTPEIYSAVKPWLCALPTTDLSPINVNTLSLEQAPLIAMLAPEGVGVDAARQVIATRPAAGWASTTDFWRMPGLVWLSVPAEVQAQPQVKTRWFTLDLRVRLQGAELIETALIDARIAPSRVVMRRWGSDA
jgi:general secretion pathway protein K